MTTEDTTYQELPNREVSVLLSLDTYQGMTDSEIQSLIDWHVSVARQQAILDSNVTTLDATMAQLISDNQTSNAAIESMLQSILERSRNVELGVIADEQA